ncbi:MAG: acyl carrier protein [Lachnospiraceae bacterium]|nr:acyl carrier protein [Lachnospiraceae bacterium]
MEMEKLKRIIADVLNVDPNEVTEETTFVEDLAADSLDILEIIMQIQDVFDIQVPQEEATKIKTVGEAAAMIRNAGKA